MKIHASQKRPTSIRANPDYRVEVAIIGAGIAGIATAHALCAGKKPASVLLIDPRAPMSYTSAQSGDNFRNWWPHPVMTAFTNDSIDRMESLARDSDDFFHLRTGGYLLATRRRSIDEFLAQLQPGIDAEIVSGAKHIQDKFPSLSTDMANVIHLKRGGDISGQQLGVLMLDRIRKAGGARLKGEVVAIDDCSPFTLTASSEDGEKLVVADVVVNAAGPFAGHVGAMLGASLPVQNVYQQKMAFEDSLGAVPRDMPFTIDPDSKMLTWLPDELEWLQSEPNLAWLTREVPGGTHCRPEGGLRGSWVKLGWAYNEQKSEPQADLANEPLSDPHFPEIVIRAAAALLPSLQPYVASPPRRFTHYGGYYTMTEENWPLIGPCGPDGS
ncbi:MAG: FAD-dependent oxidoreductase, partial [Gammaproteobacteria bacterium]|nr:FAD-dependent oxidoreductase [Gammaproteobacteria bacterium]